jgi:peroxiredoxin
MKQRGDFALFGIDIGESTEVVKKKVAEEGWTFPVLLDQRKGVAAIYGVNSHPRTFIIDKEGKVAAISIGFQKWDGESPRMFLRELLSE